MDPRILEYRHVHDLAPELRRLGTDETVRFLVPSGGDRDLLLDTLAGGRAYFGPRPRIWQWTDLYRELAAELDRSGTPVRVRRQIDPPDHFLILRHLVEALRKEREDRLPPGVLRRGFLSLLGKDLRELLREEATPEHLRAALGCPGCGEGCPDPSHPGQVLCRLYRDYLSYLDRHGLADSASVATRTRELAEGLEDPGAWGVHLVFVGFLSFTHGQGGLVRALLARGVPCTILKPWTGLEGLLDAADQFGVLPARLDSPPATLRILEAGDRRFELETLARELALWAAGDPEALLPPPFPGFEAVGVSVDPHQGEAAGLVLERYGIPHVLRGGGSVGETDLGRLPRLCADAAGSGWPTERTLRLLSLPCLGGASFPAAQARGTAPSGEEEWTAFLKGFPPFLDRFRRLRGFARDLQGGGTPPKLLRLLRDLVSRDTPWTRALADLAGEGAERDGAVHRLASATAELDRKILSLEEATPPLGEAAQNPLSGGDAVAFLETWAEEARTSQAQPLRGALTVYPGSPPVLADHRWFVLTGATAPAWPGALKESALLADGDRHSLNGLEAETLGLERTHLPVLSEVRVQREALFRRLVLTGREGCLLTRPLQDDQGRPLPPTPFEAPLVDQLSQEEPPRRRPLSQLIPLAGPLFEDAEGPLPSRRLLRGVRGNAPQEGRGEPRTRGTFSGLDRFAGCPFAFWCEQELGLGPLPGGRFDPARVGNALHELWQRAWDPQSPQRAQGLEAAAVRLFEEVFRDPNRGYRELLCDPALTRHALRLREQARRLGAVQDAQEERLQALFPRGGVLRETLEPRAILGSVSFRGRCDRADLWETPAGTVAVLLDYKLGSSKRYQTHLQLPAYVAALTESPPEGFPFPLAGYGYLCLGDGGFAGRFAQGHEDLAEAYRGTSPRKGKVSFESLQEQAWKTMGALAEALESGRYPARYDSPSCPGCPFGGLCRRGEARSEGVTGEAPEGGEDRD